MKKQLLCLLVCICLILSMIPAHATAVESDPDTDTLPDPPPAATVDPEAPDLQPEPEPEPEPEPNIMYFPISVDLVNAMGIDINLRFDPLYVESAEVYASDPVLESGQYLTRQDGSKFKIAIASGTPITFSGELLTLRLNLKEQPGAEDEVCRILQLTVNEQISYQAAAAVLLRNIRDGGSYPGSVFPDFTEGTATLNGEPFLPGTEVSQEGEYTLEITDLAGRTRTVRFNIDKTPPVITILPFDQEPTDQPVSVQASVNEGTLEQDVQVFEENGTYYFTATDAAGNTSTQEVVISHIYTTFTMTLIAPALPQVFQGGMIDPTGWKLDVLFDNGMTRQFDVTHDMVSAITEEPGQFEGNITFRGQNITFSYEVLPASEYSIVITRLPDKLVYTAGQALDSTGMEVVFMYGQENLGIIAGYSFLGYDPQQLGVQEVTVVYKQFTATFTVTVLSAIPNQITSDIYTVENGFITNVPLNTTLDVFLENIHQGEYLRVFSGEEEVFLGDPLSTGMVVRLLDGETVKLEFTIVVRGDVNGDGRITITDLMMTGGHILEKTTLKDGALLAADMNGDGKISITDQVILRAIILGKDI